jgi:hypothetical protein
MCDALCYGIFYKINKVIQTMTESIQVNLTNTRLRIWDQDNPKKNHKTQGPITKYQKMKIKKSILKKDTSKKKTRDKSG